MQQTIGMLQSLSAAGQILQAGGDVESNASKSAIKQLTLNSSHFQELQSLHEGASGIDNWSQLPQLGVSLTDVSQAVAAVMAQAPHPKASQFAAWYMSLLTSPGCPVRCAAGRS
jgi:hypothetical protein